MKIFRTYVTPIVVLARVFYALRHVIPAVYKFCYITLQEYYIEYFTKTASDELFNRICSEMEYLESSVCQYLFYECL
jgi:hypothetical protein